MTPLLGLCMTQDPEERPILTLQVFFQQQTVITGWDHKYTARFAPKYVNANKISTFLKKKQNLKFPSDLLLGVWSKSCRREHTVFEVGTSDCRVLPQQKVSLQEATTIFVLQLNRSQKPSVLPPHPSTSVRKVKGTIFLQPFQGTWRFSRDHFVNSCCISLFLVECVWTTWSQRQMHLSYLSRWPLQDTKTPNPSCPLVQEHQVLSDWTATDPVSHWVTLQVPVFSLGGNDIQTIWFSFVSSFYQAVLVTMSWCWAGMAGGYSIPLIFSSTRELIQIVLRQQLLE